MSLSRLSARLMLEALEDRAVPAFLAPVSSPGGGIPTVADVNRDGRDDVVALASKSSVSVNLSQGNGSFKQSCLLDVKSQELSQVSVGDVNSDGLPDIVATGWKGSFKYEAFDGTLEVYGDAFKNVWLGKGNGTFGFLTTTALGRHVREYPSYHPTVYADFNRDGILDLASTQEGGAVTVRLGLDGRRYAPPVTYAAGSGPCPATGDFNGDGWIDILVSTLPGNKASFSVLLNDGSW